MNKKLRELHDAYRKHSIVHLATQRLPRSTAGSAIGFCSCGLIAVTNSMQNLSWHSVENKAVGFGWLPFILSVVRSNPAAHAAWLALPDQGNGMSFEDTPGDKMATWLRIEEDANGGR